MSVAIDPLEPADVAAMLRDGVSEAAAGQIVEATGGNAFLITELARQGDASPLAEPLPRSTVGAVDRRRTTGGLAARCGGGGRGGQRARPAGIGGRCSPPSSADPPLDVAAAADEACAAGLLNQAGDGSFSFRHALVRQAVVARLAPGGPPPCTWPRPGRSSAATASTTTGWSPTT